MCLAQGRLNKKQGGAGRGGEEEQRGAERSREERTAAAQTAAVEFLGVLLRFHRRALNPGTT